MRYCPAGYIDLLAQETPGEPFNQTDAVDQAVLWVQALKQDGIPGVSTLCWNVNSGLWRPIGSERLCRHNTERLCDTHRSGNHLRFQLPQISRRCHRTGKA
jgi:hypothetical protein